MTSISAASSPVRSLDGSCATLGGRVTSRLLSDLQDQQDAASLEGRLLAGVTDLFEELTVEERRRRTSWEEKADRHLRDLRASVESDLARAACESRRLFTEGRTAASEALKVAQTCQDFCTALEQDEAPPSLMLIVRREVEAATRAEMDRLTQKLQKQLGESLSEAVREQSGQFTKESARWAEACAGQMADIIEKEQQAREDAISRLVGRLGDCESSAESRQEEMIEIARVTCAKVSGEAETRLSACFVQLREAHVTLQAGLERYAERWEQAWKEEAELRVNGDQEVLQSFQVVSQRLEVTTRAYDQRAQEFEKLLQKVDSEAGSETQLRQETDNWLLMRLTDLQKELRMESDVRNSADSQLQTGLEQIRSLVAQAISVGRLSRAEGLAEVPADVLVQTVAPTNPGSAKGSGPTRSSLLPAENLPVWTKQPPLSLTAMPSPTTFPLTQGAVAPTTSGPTRSTAIGLQR